LGPILYAIFVAPLFEMEYLEGFADDLFIPKDGSILTTLVQEMEDSLDKISKWYSQSGLKEISQKQRFVFSIRRTLKQLK
jgi:hypothetical protein